MNKVGLLFSLYESGSGEHILTKSVSGDQMESVLKEIAVIVAEHKDAILKPLRVQFGETQIVERTKMDSLAALLTLTSEHYKPATQKPVLKESQKSKIKENLTKILSDPAKISRLMKELELPSLEKGDTLLVGKFKNRRAEITGFDTDDNNQPVAKTTKGDQKIFKPRIAKLMGEDVKTPKVLAHWSSGDHVYGAVNDPMASGTHHFLVKGREYPVAKLSGSHPDWKVVHYVKRTDPYPHPLKGFNDGDDKIHFHEAVSEGYTGGVTKTYTIEASPNVIRNFERFLKHLQYCAGVGHSTVVGMDIDGDGADRFKVTDPDLPALDEGDVKDSKGTYERVRYSD